MDADELTARKAIRAMVSRPVSVTAMTQRWPAIGATFGHAVLSAAHRRVLGHRGDPWLAAIQSARFRDEPVPRDTAATRLLLGTPSPAAVAALRMAGSIPPLQHRIMRGWRRGDGLPPFDARNAHRDPVLLATYERGRR